MRAAGPLRGLFFARLLELVVLPSFCRLCGALLERPGERLVCGACLAGLPVRRGPVCPCCGRFLEAAGEPAPCGRCLDRPPAFSRHRSAGRYDGALRDVLLLYKYGRLAPLGRDLSAFVERSPAAGEDLWAGLDAVVPVPLHRARRRERGFNQSELVARSLARGRGLPVLVRALVKTRPTPPQTSLAAGERAANARDAYAARDPGKIRGLTLIVVDDVFTTGATLGECAAVLKAAGAREVRALTVAQA